ncbi:MAG: DUF5698 domain-containing protein [Planctomycetota bacterium]|jgi:uncharacterized protein YebE (UPF0316 family)|nr:DUF5698 domain-containing protein [Planctomycetota bacterium]
MDSEALITAFIIFLARCTDVTMDVIRILMLVRGRKILAAGMGFFEVMVYIMVMNAIMGGGKSLSLPQLIAYCGGYASGNVIGSWLESKLLNAYVMMEIIMAHSDESSHLAERLREAGFGTTVLTGEGKNGPNLVFKVICYRREVAKVSEIAKGLGGFIFFSDLKGVSGGYFRSRGYK